jgi:OHCU decarboxylase
MFGTVAVIGIQTLSRVDFHDDRNVIVVAVSLGFALIPVAFPRFYSHFSNDVQTIVGSGITMGSFSAILLNLFLNILGGKRNLVDEVEPTAAHADKLTIEQVNGLSDAEFVDTFGGLFQGEPWIAAEVARMRPFDSLYAMRAAFHGVLFDTSEQRQDELIRAYPDLAAKVALGPESRRDQAWAGLDRLTPEEYERFDALNEAYHKRFGHPFIICVRENTKESILDSFERRLAHTAKEERMAALVEVAKIANQRLFDLVQEHVVDQYEAPPVLGETPAGRFAAGNGGAQRPRAEA